MFRKRKAGCPICGDNASTHPFVTELVLQNPEVFWNDRSEHEEAQYLRALSPALTLYRSLEVLGLESLMCGDCGAGSREEGGPDHVDLTAAMYGVYDDEECDSSDSPAPRLTFHLHTGFETPNPAEALAGALHACSEECSVRGGAKQLIQTALQAVGAAARVVHDAAHAGFVQQIAGVQSIMQMPRLDLVQDVACCRRQRSCRSGEGAERFDAEEHEHERLARRVRALAQPGSDGEALYSTLKVMGWMPDALQLTAAMAAISMAQLRHAGRVPPEVAQELREMGAHVPPSDPSFGNLPKEARDRGCRLLHYAGDAAYLRWFEGVARDSLWDLAKAAAVGAALCALLTCTGLMNWAAVARFPQAALHAALTGACGWWYWLLGLCIQKEQGTGARGGRSAVQATAAGAGEKGRTLPDSPGATRGGGKGRKAPAGPRPAAVSKTAPEAVAPSSGGHGVAKGRGGGTGASVPAAAKNNTGRQPEAQQPSLTAHGLSRQGVKPAAAQKRRGSTISAPAHAPPAAAMDIIDLTSTPSHDAGHPKGALPSAAAGSDQGDAEEDPNRLCVMCLDAPRNFGFLHGAAVHTGVCSDCSVLLRRRMPGLECPLCRVPVEEIVGLF
ncbi:hypothetical protein HYH03_009623 [Edaphochlamys debaryana]|uniref:RING-type domain-containing protein n=1 Tax=Edaphochlamys debaryana TaxID=47281 RepID=A0A836BXM3_9CHLO|nr:hypothetical protein HYH03_009623 [Edaphochlamys debaryana]|eukprot:KAG2492132.1 hypothetical protein HYH03_009623 [Edaphochlamys debaryana]